MNAIKQAILNCHYAFMTNDIFIQGHDDFKFEAKAALGKGNSDTTLGHLELYRRSAKENILWVQVGWLVDGFVYETIGH